VRTPKLHFVDSGLLTALRGYTAARLRSERELPGPPLEGFIFVQGIVLYDGERPLSFADNLRAVPYASLWA